MGATFTDIARRTSIVIGSPWAFLVALATVLLWALLGPAFGYSDTWQLVINTGTTIITFLVVFLIQNTQNRESHALQLKLDELIHASRGASDTFIDLEYCTDEELQALQAQFSRLRDKGRLPSTSKST